MTSVSCGTILRLRNQELAYINLNPRCQNVILGKYVTFSYFSLNISIPINHRSIILVPWSFSRQVKALLTIAMMAQLNQLYNQIYNLTQLAVEVSRLSCILSYVRLRRQSRQGCTNATNFKKISCTIVTR